MITWRVVAARLLVHVKAPSPLLGFNDNVRHKGRMFHVQTEDSGVRHPHVITHLFADGGRILKTTKTSYAEQVSQEKLADIVRGMMKEQHKAMIVALREGQFDSLFEEGVASPRVAPLSNRAPEPARAPVPPLPPRVRLPATPPSPPALQEVPSTRRRGSRPRISADTSAIHGGPPAPPVGGDPSIDQDLDALERAAAEPQTPVWQQIRDLPPPPAAVLGAKRPQVGPGGYSVRSSPPSLTPATRLRQTPPNAPGRYAPSRPASIFATTRPQEGTSIFGEDLMSEKSLDEVILSYLAEDLDTPSDKKR